MFEHLDDPAPPEPTAGPWGRCWPARPSAPSAGRPRRSARSWWVRSGVGVVIGVVVSGPTPSQTFAAFDSQTGLLAAGTPVPSSDLARSCSSATCAASRWSCTARRRLLAVSADGGDTWTVADPSLPVSFPAQFEFSDAAHGYLWGGPPSAIGDRRRCGSPRTAGEPGRGPGSVRWSRT